METINMLTTQEALEAYIDGRPVQIEISPGVWKDIEEDNVGSSGTGRYRIRPPRPYKNAEEFLEAQKKHGPYVKYREDSLNYYYVSVIRVYPESVDLGIFRGHSANNVRKITYEMFLETKYFIWQDGTVCGVE